MISLDTNGYTCPVVIVCDECPWWSAIRTDRDEAHTCAANHEREHHPESRQARNAARQWRNRRRTVKF